MRKVRLAALLALSLGSLCVMFVLFTWGRMPQGSWKFSVLSPDHWGFGIKYIDYQRTGSLNWSEEEHDYGLFSVSRLVSYRSK
jgi:hypothetical protein